MLYTLVYSIYAVFLILSVKNWRRGVVLWAAWRYVFGINLCLKYYPPAVTLDLAMDLTLLGLFLFSKEKNKFNFKIFPYRKVFYVYAASYTLTQLFSILPGLDGYLKYIKFFIQNFGFLYLFFIAIKDVRYFKMFLNNLIICGFIFCIYGILEFFTHTNPVNDLVTSTIPQDILNGKSYYNNDMYEQTQRFGHFRVQSLFNIHIAYGVASVTVAYLVIQLQNYMKTILYLALISVLMTSAFICTSKTSMLGALSLLLLFINPKYLNNPRRYIVIVILALIIVPVISDYFIAVSSVFNSHLTSEDAGGSTIYGRKEQFAAMFYLFSDRPILGYGIGSGAILVQNKPLIQGLESAFLRIPLEEGLLGLFAFFYFWYTSYKYGLKNIGKWPTFCFLFTFLIMNTVTGAFDIKSQGIIFLATVQYYQISKLKSPQIHR